jgi:ABC-type Fe3+/spermidine/putrescine transport system ATPase subunit
MGALEIEGLRLEANGEAILDGTDLTVASREYLAILGPSGCGKTTLLRAIAGLVRPTAGRIVLGGEPLCDVARGVHLPPERRAVGMAFQHQALWPHLDARATLRFALRHGAGLRGPAAEQRVSELLADVHLEHCASKAPGQMSGGERQRLSIARALARGPRVLLLDEPLGPLDAHLRREVQEMLRALHAKLGLITLHVTHDRDEAFQAGGRAAILRAGRVLQVGTREQMLAAPVEPFVSAFLASN